MSMSHLPPTFPLRSSHSGPSTESLNPLIITHIFLLSHCSHPSSHVVYSYRCLIRPILSSTFSQIPQNASSERDWSLDDHSLPARGARNERSRWVVFSSSCPVARCLSLSHIARCLTLSPVQYSPTTMRAMFESWCRLCIPDRGREPCD